MNELAVAAAVGAGLTLLVVGILLRAREREQSLAEILDLPFGERDVPVEAITETRASLVENISSFAGRAIEHVDAKRSVARSLEQARIPLKVGEYVVVITCATLVSAIVLGFVTSAPVFAALGGALALLAGWTVPRFRIRRRKRAFEAELPSALSLIASSLSAGHTFLRSIQMMCEESDGPLSEEFSRVVYETRLGDSLVDALTRMAARLDIRDVHWVVQAIRIQQTVGGKLADLLHTLADFIRAREEVRREVNVLTAEGRISAWVLGALPVFLLFIIQLVNPGYMQPLFEGKGVFVLAGCGLSMITGIAVIFKMVRIEI